MTRSFFAALSMSVCVALAGCASAEHEAAPRIERRAEADPVGAQLFPPELVLAHADALALTEEQRSSIAREIARTQGEMQVLRSELERAREALVEVVSAAHIDEGRALEHADAVMTLETRVKRAHLILVVRIKNTLTPEQQRRLRELAGP